MPEWGYVKPFAIKKGTQHRPPAPPDLKSEAFAHAYHEVKRLGAKDSQTRTEEQTQIAHFWADNVGTVTPPGVRVPSLTPVFPLRSGTSRIDTTRPVSPR